MQTHVISDLVTLAIVVIALLVTIIDIVLTERRKPTDIDDNDYPGW